MGLITIFLGVWEAVGSCHHEAACSLVRHEKGMSACMSLCNSNRNIFLGTQAFVNVVQGSQNRILGVSEISTQDVLTVFRRAERYKLYHVWRAMTLK